MKKILYVKWGGLGDHLQFTTLPELFSKQGFDFYISDRSEYRDQRHYELIWESNPYVKGISSEEPNCGHIANFGSSTLVQFDPNLSMMTNIEKIYGLQGYFNYPKIYHEPKLLSQFENCIFLDLNAFSVADRNHDIHIITEYLDKFRGQKVFYATSDSSYGRSIVPLEIIKKFDFQPIQVQDIFHYVDIIYSSSRFISLWSGGSNLSVAIKKSFKDNLDLDCFKADYGDPDWGVRNKSFFWYDCVNYIKC